VQRKIFFFISKPFTFGSQGPCVPHILFTPTWQNTKTAGDTFDKELEELEVVERVPAKTAQSLTETPLGNLYALALAF
jgi:hypothetical protein